MTISYIAVTTTDINKCGIMALDNDLDLPTPDHLRFFRKFADFKDATKCVKQHLFDLSREELAGMLYLIEDYKLRLQEVAFFDPDDLGREAEFLQKKIDQLIDKSNEIKLIRRSNVSDLGCCFKKQWLNW